MCTGNETFCYGLRCKKKTFTRVYVVYSLLDNACFDTCRKLFESRGIITAESRWYEHPLTPDWYSQLIPGIDLPLSMKIVDHMRDEGWLDERNVISSTDFQKDWYGTTRRWNLTPRHNHEGELLDIALYEETMVAYAKHKTFARKNEDMFAWFEGSYRSQESSISSM